MAGLFGSAPASSTPTKYNQLQLQTSTAGLPIPVGWGKNVWSPNIIWYNNFQAQPADKGGKGGAKSGSYTYTASVILALGEGPITGIDTVYADQGYSTLGSLNLYLYNGTENQAPVPFIEDEYPDQALPYAYTAYLSSEVFSLGNSGALPNMKFEVVAHLSGSVPGVPDACFADIVQDMITNSQYGLDPGATYIDPITLGQFRRYNFAQGIFASPYLNRSEKALSILQRWFQLANTWGFWSGLQLKFAPLGDAPLTGNGATYIPNTSIMMEFTEDDFILNGENTLEFDIIDPWNGYNHFELDFTERSQNYTINPIYWEDQTSVDTYGQLQSQIISASEICSQEIGYVIAQLIGKRSTYIRRFPKWKTNNMLAAALEPGDIVSLSMASMGLSKYPVRITSVKEDSNFIVELNAEEFPYGVGQATYYAPQAGSGTGVPNQYAPPPLVNVPAIFEPPTSITGGLPQIWLAASGYPNWGGCQVWVSPDGTNYAQLGNINQASAQGTLTSNLGSVAGLDVTSVLSIDSTESHVGPSTAATPAMADDYQTASLIDSEFLSYGTATLTGANMYNLTYLRRGIEGSTAAMHNAGAQWTGINPNACLQYTYPQNYVGKTLYFKFPSKNQFGNSIQTLAECVAYPYIISGTAYTIAPPSGINPEVVGYGAGGAIQIYASWEASPGPNLASYNLQFSDNGGLTWAFTQSIGGGATDGYLTTVIANTNYIARVQAVSTTGQTSTWVTSSVVNSGTTPISPPSAPTSLTATQASSSSVRLNWTAPTDTSLTGQLLSRAENSTTYTNSSVVATISAPTNTYLDTGLAVTNEYTYWLTNVNPAGASPLSNDATVTLELTIVTSNGNTVTSNGNTVTQGMIWAP